MFLPLIQCYYGVQAPSKLLCKWYLTIWSTRILVYQKEEEEKLRKEEEERLKKEEEERIKQDQEEKLKVNCL